MAISEQYGKPLVYRSFGTGLEFLHDHVRVIPNWFLRVSGQPSEEAAITPKSAEILLCHRFWQERPNGWRVIVRAADGDECELGGALLIYLSALDVNIMTEAIASATGLPVRAVIRRQLLSGAVEEEPWTPPIRMERALRLVAITTTGFPIVGGIIMGLLLPHSHPVVVIAVGLALWLCLMIALFALKLIERNKFPMLSALTTLVTSSAIYAVCFVVTAYAFHP